MTRRNFLVRMTAAGLAASFFHLFFLKRRRKLSVTYGRISLKTNAKRLRIVAASDLHAPYVYVSMNELVSKINRTRPDIFILAGDTLGKAGSEDIVLSLNSIKTRVAKLAVLGNWEYQLNLNLDKLKLKYQSAGIKLLENDIYEVQGLKIIGLDDFLFGSPNLDLFNESFIRHEPVIAVSHCPESFDLLPSRPGVPLFMISGHTHGGQIAPMGRALITPKGSGSYVHGWYHKDNRAMYVMRGVGTSIVPIRIGTEPEIAVIDIEGNA
jgi:predicted MPP superfamily phosphohydrolase